MKRIMLTSLSYGSSEAENRAINDLIMAGRLSAVGCLVTTPLWEQEYYQLRDVANWANKSPQVGLSLSFTAPFSPLSQFAQQNYGKTFPPPWYVQFCTLSRRLQKQVVEAEIATQIDRFEEIYAQAPQFLAIHPQTPKSSIFYDAIIKAALLMSDRQPYIILPSQSHHTAKYRKLAQVLDISLLFSRFSLPVHKAKAGYKTVLWEALNHCQNEEVVYCSPSYEHLYNGYVPKPRPKAVQFEQLNFLMSDQFQELLNEKDIYLF